MGTRLEQGESCTKRLRSTAPLKRPNILFIQLDQLSPHALRLYGNKVSKTPNIDRLMGGGDGESDYLSTVFTNAYCNSPICSPSRFSMMAGKLPTQIAAWDNAAEFSSEVPTYCHLLRLPEFGNYHTVMAGKMHFVGADQLHGFEERLTTDVYPADFGWAPNWDEERTGEINPMFFETLMSVAEADWVHSSMQLDFDEEVAFATKRKLREFGRERVKQQHLGDEGEVRPFFIHASFTQPHDPYSGPKQFWDLYTDEEIDLPQVPFIARADRDPHSQRVYDCMDGGRFDITEARIRKARRAYYAMLSYVDNLIGQLLATLDEEGLKDETLIVLSADHGDMQGERGMWFKETFFERSSRVPLFFSGTRALSDKLPGNENSGLKAFLSVPRRACNVSLVDLFPTFLRISLAGQPLTDAGIAEVLSELEGKDLFDDQDDGGVFCEYTSEMIPGGWFMVKRKGYKLIYSGEGALDGTGLDGSIAPILFDLEKDTAEMKNVADVPEYSDALQELLALARAKWPDLQRLRERILRSQRNRRLVHRGMRAPAKDAKGERWEYAPPYEGWKKYARNTDDSLQDQEYLCRAPYRGKRPAR